MDTTLLLIIIIPIVFGIVGLLGVFVISPILKKRKRQAVLNALKMVGDFTSEVEYISDKISIVIDFGRRKVFLAEKKGNTINAHVFDYKDLLQCKLIDTRKEIGEKRALGKEFLATALFGAAGAYFARATYTIGGFTGRISLELDARDEADKSHNHRITFFSTRTPQPFGEFYNKACEATLVYIFINSLMRIADLERGDFRYTDELLKLISNFNTDFGKKLNSVFQNTPLAPEEFIITVYDDFFILTNKRIYFAWENRSGVQARVVLLSEIKNLDFKFQGGWHKLKIAFKSGSPVDFGNLFFPNYFPAVLKYFWSKNVGHVS